MNSILIFTYPLGITIVLALVIGLGIFFTRKYNLGWRLYWIGGVLFIVSQVLHIPFNFLLDSLFRNNVIPTPPENYQVLFSALLLGLSAGLFEELVRYAGLRWWAKDARNWPKGLLFGSGWGGMEAIILYVILLSLNYAVFLALRTQDLSTLIPPEQLAPLQEGMNLFWGVTWYESMLGALERILVLPIQISLTILVLQVFRRGQSRWLWISIAWHTLLNASLLITLRQWGIYATYSILTIFTLLSIGIIFALRGEEPDTEVEGQEIAPDDKNDPGQVVLTPIEESSDNIDQTRFTE
jgi:uncharacterized membrane protein YhfC